MAMMATISLIQQDLGGKLDWIDPTHYRCGSGQLPWEEIRAIAPVVNTRVLDGAKITSFIYSSRGGKDGFPKVRVLHHPHCCYVYIPGTTYLHILLHIRVFY